MTLHETSTSRMIALLAVILSSTSQVATAEEGAASAQMPRSAVDSLRSRPSRGRHDRMTYVRRAAFNRKVNFGFEAAAYPAYMNEYYKDPASRQMAEYQVHFNQGQLWDRRKSALAVSAALRESLPGSTVAPNPWYETVTTAKGQSYAVGGDPGIIEVQPPKAKLHQVKKTLRPIYDAFAKADIAPGIRGGGHIHVDNALFKENPLLLRNVLVDMYNNGLLKLVMRPGDKSSAQSMWQRGEGKAFATAIQAIDKQASANGGKYSIDQVLQGMAKFYVPKDGRYRDVNLQNFYSGHDGRQAVPTVEFRFFEAQKNAQEAHLLSKLMSRYLGGLSTVRQPLAVATVAQVDAWNRGVDAGGNYNYKAVEKQWRRFVHKLDLNYKDYKPFVEQWREAPAASPQQ